MMNRIRLHNSSVLCKMTHSILHLYGSSHRTIQANWQNDMTVVFREHAMVVITALQRSSGTAYITVNNQFFNRQQKSCVWFCQVLHPNSVAIIYSTVWALMECRCALQQIRHFLWGPSCAIQLPLWLMSPWPPKNGEGVTSTMHSDFWRFVTNKSWRLIPWHTFMCVYGRGRGVTWQRAH